MSQQIKLITDKTHYGLMSQQIKLITDKTHYGLMSQQIQILYNHQASFKSILVNSVDLTLNDQYLTLDQYRINNKFINKALHYFITSEFGEFNPFKNFYLEYLPNIIK